VCCGGGGGRGRPGGGGGIRSVGGPFVRKGRRASGQGVIKGENNLKSKNHRGDDSIFVPPGCKVSLEVIQG